MANMCVGVAQSAIDSPRSAGTSESSRFGEEDAPPRNRGGEDTTSRTKGIPPNGGARRADRCGEAVCARSAQMPALPNAAIR